jgi:hypothetical protein
MKKANHIKTKSKAPFFRIFSFKIVKNIILDDKKTVQRPRVIFMRSIVINKLSLCIKSLTNVFKKIYYFVESDVKVSKTKILN